MLFVLSFSEYKVMQGQYYRSIHSIVKGNHVPSIITKKQTHYENHIFFFALTMILLSPNQ